MITWLSNVLTGRFHHWNVANNRYVSTLVERAKTFPPAIAPLFVQLSCASHLVVESLLGPHKGRKRIIKKDVKEISESQFRSLHHLNIWTFVASFGYLNPGLREPLFAACEDFIGTPEAEKGIIAEVLRMGKLDVGKICSALLERAATILNVHRSERFEFDWVVLAAIFSTAFSAALEAYKRELSRLGQPAKLQARRPQSRVHWS